MRWYVIETLHRSERIALEHLKRQGFPVFLPTEVVRGKNHETERPAFPGYLFVKLDLRSRWRSINGTRGVKRILGNDPEAPTPVIRGIAERIIARCPLRDHVVIDLIQDGEVVRVSFGPLVGRTGKIKIDKFGRLKLLMQLFDRETAVPVQRHWLSRSVPSPSRG